MLVTHGTLILGILSPQESNFLLADVGFSDIITYRNASLPCETPTKAPFNSTAIFITDSFHGVGLEPGALLRLLAATLNN